MGRQVPAIGTHALTPPGAGYCGAAGALDVVIANSDAADRVCRGEGDGTFSACEDVGVTPILANDVAAGTIDAVFANTGSGRNRVCLGNGDGTFTCADIGDDENDSSGVALADFGDPDIFADGFESGDTSAWATTVP